MIYLIWKSSRGIKGIPVCACSANDPADQVNEVIFTQSEVYVSGAMEHEIEPVGEGEMKWKEVLNGPEARRVKFPNSYSVQQMFSSVILARAIAVVKVINPTGKVILFSEGAIGAFIRSALYLSGIEDLLVAAVPPVNTGDIKVLIPEDDLDPYSPGFVDRMKLETDRKGFATILVASSDPEMVRKALGCAGVFGEVTLLLPVLEKVRVDLAATINFKSLKIRVLNFFQGLRDLEGQDISEATEKMSFLSPLPDFKEKSSGFTII